MINRTTAARTNPRAARSGQALVEFAIISFVLTAMLAGFLGLIVLGLGSFQNNIATENAGRVLDEHPVLIREHFVTHFSDSMSDDFFDPNNHDFENVTARQVFRFLTEYQIAYDLNGETEMLPLYDESLLILSPDRWRYLTDPDDPGNTKEIPEINRSLLPSYIFDPDVALNGEAEQGAYRYPGAVVERTTADGETYQTVLIPILDDTLNGEPVNGVERTFNIKPLELTEAHPVARNWVAPVTVVRSIESSGAKGPTFKLVIFYPSQPASMIDLAVVRDSENRITSQAPEALNAGTTHSEFETLPAGYQFPETAFTANPKFGASSSRGKYGLGESFAFVTTVRPYRAVFEASSLFRLEPTPAVVKYEADESDVLQLDDEFDLSEEPPTSDTPVAPFSVYQDNHDQPLDFEVHVADRFSDGLQRYFTDFPIVPPPSADNDFVTNVLQLLPHDDGVWRVSVAAEFEANVPWAVNHVLQLWLYKNGVRESLIAAHKVAMGHSERISISGQTLIKVDEGDILQVRVFTDEDGVPEAQTNASISVSLTGQPETNWVSFERIED
ncbi:hypothetical protein CA51_25100 [Rosistilla oblonga]|uniref:pilus assembly protein n=1 Tax=Rosistilla oblonga TaxID=2527990 RepID=UPI001187E5CF|nr:pilus assembly protein [Rosistilla oblonga]QDV12624.1 hypothetical protein CA51_25100 [Rosistilla oblonga]